MKRKAQLKGGLTEEGRKRISDSLKKRWETPEYKELYSLKMKGNRNHSDATREKISKAIKEKWLDNDYRSIERKPPTEEVRARISSSLKARWEEPAFREKMKNSSYTRSDEWRAVVSQKVREKWKDPAYKAAVTSALRKHFDAARISLNGTTWTASPRRRASSVREKLTEEEALQRREGARRKAADSRKAKEMKKEALKAAKKAVRSKDHSADLKTLLGGELWFEEKVPMQCTNNALKYAYLKSRICSLKGKRPAHFS